MPAPIFYGWMVYIVTMLLSIFSFQVPTRLCKNILLESVMFYSAFASMEIICFPGHLSMHYRGFALSDLFYQWDIPATIITQSSFIKELHYWQSYSLGFISLAGYVWQNDSKKSRFCFCHHAFNSRCHGCHWKIGWLCMFNIAKNPHLTSSWAIFQSLQYTNFNREVAFHLESDSVNLSMRSANYQPCMSWMLFCIVHRN